MYDAQRTAYARKEPNNSIRYTQSPRYIMPRICTCQLPDDILGADLRIPGIE